MLPNSTLSYGFLPYWATPKLDVFPASPYQSYSARPDVRQKRKVVGKEGICSPSQGRHRYDR